jgi:hypothetical protein
MPTPPPGCTPDQVIVVAHAMSSVPPVTLHVANSKVQWTGELPFIVLMTNQPSGNPYPGLSSVDPQNWYSCALSVNATSPVDYSVTFTNDNHRIYGRIIILKPVED